MRARGWPAVLTGRVGQLELVMRPLRVRDAPAWRSVRQRNIGWLGQWDATVPPGQPEGGSGYRETATRLLRSARRGGCMPFVLEVDDRFAGQVTVNNIVRGSAQFASLGYWLDQDLAGRGVMPHAVAMLIDHLFGPAGLHRVEICIRPENTNSLRVVEKLGLREVGFAPRFLHIDGDWRDHRIYAVTVEECPGGMVARLARESH